MNDTDATALPALSAEADVSPIRIDGRRLRRERGRSAVTDAMIDLVMEGHVPPTTEQLAERADVSVASVFRYFDGLDDLRRAATTVYFERFGHLLEIERIGVGPLGERIDRFVTARLVLYSTAEPIGRLIRSRSNDDLIASANLARLRSTYVDQIHQHFDRELSALDHSGAEQTAVTMATLTSFESWVQCRHHHGFADHRIRDAWTTALAALIGARA